MTSFDVLSPFLDISQSRLIEASAGTGKTFALEHLTVRWLLSAPEASLDKIALITFTRKAAQDLRLRLRDRFEKAYNELRDGPCQSPYLQALQDEKKPLALLRLVESLMNFDLMPISTIHAFAAKLLSRSGWFFEAESGSDVEKEYLRQLVELHLESLHVESAKHQLSLSKEDSLVLKLVETLNWDVDTLTEELAVALSCGLEIGSDSLASLDVWGLFFEKDSASPSFDELLTRSNEFKGSYYSDGKTIKPDHKKNLDHWKRCCQERKIFDPEKLIDLLKHFQEGNRKKKASEESREIALWVETKKEALEILSRSSLKKRGLEILANRLKKSLSPLFKKDFRLGHDVILQKLEEMLNSPMGPALARSLQLLIVDEFQDTDPRQWRLFQKLTQLNPSLQIILVGDPKQSIYGFRQADIYTYLAAKEYVRFQLKGSIDQLTTNYRSHPYLVEALNQLFAASEAGAWLKLPRLCSHLPCPEVSAGRRGSCEAISARVHFHDLDSHQTSDPLESAAVWVQHEYTRLKALGLRSFAVLIGQHDKGRKMQKLLAERGVLTHIQKPLSFAKLPSFEFFKLILEAFEKPYLGERMRRLWSHPLWQLGDEEREGLLGLKQVSLSDETFSRDFSWTLFWQQLTRLHHLLIEKGVGAFWESFWQLELGAAGSTLYMRLMRSAKGFEIYDQMNALWLWLETEDPHLFARDALKKMESLEAEDNEELAVYHPKADRSAIHILTVHASKGLEYEVVFCLSNLISKGNNFQRWMQIYHEEEPRLVAFEAEHPHYLSACDEIDAEKARKLYVAWTRAREYLFIGYQPQKRTVKPKRSQATPFELFVASWQRPQASTIAQLYESFEEEEPGSRFFDRLSLLQKQKKVGISSCILLNQESQLSIDFTASKEENERETAFEKKAVKIQKELWQRSSFSSLLRGSKHLAEVLFDEKKAYEDPLFFESFESDEMGSVPRGTEVGTLWHLMFQRALQLLQRGVCLDSIQAYLSSEPFLKGACFLDEGEKHVLSMASQVVKLLDKTWEIKVGSESLAFRFTDLPKGSIWTEKNFEISRQEVELQLKEQIQMGRDPVQLTGVIDALVHLPQGLIFIDWKSNWIGPRTDFYNEGAILENVHEHRYDLQALIYQRAIESSLLVKRGTPLIAGLYVYIRGGYPLVWSVSKKGFEGDF